MVAEAHKVGPNRYRERSGRYFEDFTVGDIYEHRPNRTISETDNTWFTLLTMNTHPLHFDAEYAKHSEFGRCIVCSPLTVALMAGMSVSNVSQKAIANLGWREIKLTHPLFIGDTLSAKSEVLDKRESKSRPQAGHRHRQDSRLQPAGHAGLRIRPDHPGRQARFRHRGEGRLLTPAIA